MDYKHREDLRYDSADMRTTMMTRSVREILAEQGQAHLLDAESFEPASEAPTMPPRPMPGAAITACAAAKGGLQRPPHMSGTLNTTTQAPASLPFRAEASQTASGATSRSLLSRLIGR